MTPQLLAAKGSESGHQKALFAWAAIAALHGFAAARYPASYLAPGWQWASDPVPVLRWLHAIPNGGARNPATAARLKAEGVRAGIPDIFLPVAVGCYHGLYIELKAETGKLSKEQSEFGRFCSEQGFAFVVCYGWKDATKFVE